MFIAFSARLVLTFDSLRATFSALTLSNPVHVTPLMLIRQEKSKSPSLCWVLVQTKKTIVIFLFSIKNVVHFLDDECFFPLFLLLVLFIVWFFFSLHTRCGRVSVISVPQRRHLRRLGEWLQVPVHRGLARRHLRTRYVTTTALSCFDR